MAYPSETHTTRRKVTDWLKYNDNPNFTHEGADITAPSGGLDLQTGTLLTGGSTPVAYDEASPAAVTGILITDVKIAEGETLPIAWLSRGPATVNTTEVGMPVDGTKNTTVRAALTALGLRLVADIGG